MNETMKRNIMKRAHELAKKMIGDYKARMSLALRQAWREAKKVVEGIEKYVGKRIKFETRGKKAEGTVKEIVEMVGGKGLKIVEITVENNPVLTKRLKGLHVGIFEKEILEVL